MCSRGVFSIHLLFMSGPSCCVSSGRMPSCTWHNTDQPITEQQLQTGRRGTQQVMTKTWEKLILFVVAGVKFVTSYKNHGIKESLGVLYSLHRHLMLCGNEDYLHTSDRKERGPVLSCGMIDSQHSACKSLCVADVYRRAEDKVKHPSLNTPHVSHTEQRPRTRHRPHLTSEATKVEAQAGERGSFLQQSPVYDLWRWMIRGPRPGQGPPSTPGIMDIYCFRVQYELLLGRGSDFKGSSYTTRGNWGFLSFV